MSNFLAVATVTAALCEALQNAIHSQGQGGVAGAQVTHLPPGSDQLDAIHPGVNVFLYQGMINASLANDDLPTRRADGTALQRPRAALYLCYLLTFHGDNGKLEPQRLFGSVSAFLHADPILTRSLVRQVIARIPYLSDSTLADQHDVVRITPSMLTLDELSRLWLMFPQVDYQLSALYQAGPILLDWPEIPTLPLPVRAMDLRTFTLNAPRIDRLTTTSGQAGWPEIGKVLVITGENLMAPVMEVWIGSEAVTPLSVQSSEIRIALDPVQLPALRAGPSSVKILHQSDDLSGRRIATAVSNSVHLVILPLLLAITAETIPPSEGDASDTPTWQVTARLQPRIGARQVAELLLNAVTPAGQPGPVYIAEGRETDSDEVLFKVSRIPPGTYLARLRVDGAETILTVDTDPDSADYRRYTGPILVLS